MLNVLDSTKQLYMESSHKKVTISIPGKSLYFNNASIVGESMTLKEAIETNDNLQFKGCNASCLKVSVAGLVMDVRGQYIEANIQAEDSEVIPLFKGYIADQDNRTYEDVVTELKCYDVLYTVRNLDFTSWYSSLSSSMTVKQFRDSAFSYLSSQYGITITQEDVTLPNDSITLNKIDAAKLPKVINFIWVLESICQANVRPGQIGRDGKFYYRRLKAITKGLYPSTETFPSDETYPSGENSDVRYDLSTYSSIKYEPYYVEKITGVVLRGIDGSATTQGTSDNVFDIADNLVCQMIKSNQRTTACTNILNEVKNVWYIPMMLDCRGLPWVECGDAIYTNTRRNVVRSFVLFRTLKGMQALFDSLEADGKQYRDKYSESEETGISTNRNQTKINSDRIGTIEANTLIAQMVQTNQLSAKYIKGGGGDFGYLNADCIEAGTINADKLATNSVTASKVASGAITADKIAAGAITADKISADAFDGNRFSGQAAHFGTVYNEGTAIYVGTRKYEYKTVNISGTVIKYLGTDAIN